MNAKYSLIQSQPQNESFRKKDLQVHSKYKHVWQSAKMKLKFRLVLQKMIKGSIFMKEPQMPIQGNLNEFSLLKSESTSLIGKSSWIFDPNSYFIRFWNLLIGMIIVQSAIVMPFFLAFPVEGDIDLVEIFDNVFTLTYLLDFLINCNKGFIDENKTIVKNRKLIILKYFKSWMIIDLIAFFPFDLFITTRYHLNPLAKLVRVPRLYKLLKFSKAFKWMKFRNNPSFLFITMDVLNLRYSTLRTLITILTILAMLHIITCLWCFIGLATLGSDSWIIRNELQDFSNFSLYLSGFYWALSTYSTVGYGDISAGNDFERILSVFWMICCNFFLAITVATLSSFLTGLDSKENLLLYKLAVIDEFSVQTGLKKQFRIKLRESIRQNSTISAVGFAEKKEIFQELPKELQFEMALNMHRGAARTLRFFRDKDDFFICAVVPFLTPVFVMGGNDVYCAGALADEIYFLVKGKVIYVESDGLAVYTVKQKDYFGDIEVISKVPRNFHAKSKENSELLLFSYQLMKKIRRDHPLIWSELTNTAIARKKIMEKSVKRIKKLRKLSRIYSRHKIEAIQFQTYQKIKRDMKNSCLEETSLLKKVVDEGDVAALLDKMDACLMNLQGKVFDLSSKFQDFDQVD
jgi:CRP-like cAMP-binding protein